MSGLGSFPTSADIHSDTEEAKALLRIRQWTTPIVTHDTNGRLVLVRDLTFDIALEGTE